VAKEVISLQQYQQVIVGLVAIAGHNWPVFLRFNGGRGILAALGVVFALAPWLALVLTVVAFAWLPFGQFAFGTLLALLLLPILSWAVPGLFGVQRSLELTLGFAGILLIAVIRRLTAPRTELSATVSQGELIVNRLLFDRDIKDRKAWVSRKPLAGPDSLDEVAGQEKEEGQESR
jgi:glycerol-3-phosphate acyltransferase PlsY